MGYKKQEISTGVQEGWVSSKSGMAPVKGQFKKVNIKIDDAIFTLFGDPADFMKHSCLWICWSATINQPINSDNMPVRTNCQETFCHNLTEKVHKETSGIL